MTPEYKDIKAGPIWSAFLLNTNHNYLLQSSYT